MQAIDAIRSATQLSYDWNRTLADDMRDAPLTVPTLNGGNHPTWVVGHAVHARAGLLSMITGEPSPYEDWTSRLGAGSQPVSDSSVYPSYEELLSAWKRVHQRTLDLLESVGEAGLDRVPVAVPANLKHDPHFATVGNVFLFIALHEMLHCGQLADARRVAGKKPLV